MYSVLGLLGPRLVKGLGLGLGIQGLDEFGILGIGSLFWGLQYFWGSYVWVPSRICKAQGS